jgi:excisionase family DNA binding protein
MSTPWSSDDLRPVLSTEEVAELLRLNPRTVLAMARDGRLPGHRLPGCRKVQYLTDEILATLADAPGMEEMTARKPSGLTPERAVPTEVDPCDVWGAAPSWEPNEDWRERCRSHWMELANQAGLPEVKAAESHDAKDVSGDERSAGHVDVDGLLYEVLVGPRQRSRYVDDEGEVRWGLIDAVWVQPVLAADRGAWCRAPWQTT